jgi:N-acetylmuramoyl-L-alanine amidase
MISLGPVRYITVHHSASDIKTTVEDIDKWHRQRGWDGGCGYHFVIEGDGRTRIGRAIEYQGAHVKGHNSGNVGICLVGNNTTWGEQWTHAQCVSLRELCFSLVTVFSLETADILGHRDWDDAATKCPGIDIHNFLGS